MKNSRKMGKKVKSKNQPKTKSKNQPISLPSNISETEVVDIIDRIAKRLANKFKFGYHETKDMEQEARSLAWEGLSGYDGIRPLENYLWAHVHNRLFNFKRDNYIRPYCPCMKCKSRILNDKCNKYEDRSECESFLRWVSNNNAKLNIIHPLEYSCVDDNNEDKMSNCTVAEDYLIDNELKQVLDKHIPIEFRHYYLRLIYGYKVRTKYKIPLLKIIREIIDKYHQKEDN